MSVLSTEIGGPIKLNYDQLEKLHDDIKNFKIEYSKKTLLGFYDADSGKFDLLHKRGQTGGEGEPRLHFSMTAICTNTAVEYKKIWQNTNTEESPTQIPLLDPIKSYKYLIEGFRRHLDERQEGRTNSAIDLFTLLNVLSVIKPIRNSLPAEELKKINDLPVILGLICFVICYYNETIQKTEKPPHPFFYYKCLCILKDWKDESVISDEYAIKRVEDIYAVLPFDLREKEETKNSILQKMNEIKKFQNIFELVYDFRFEKFSETVYKIGKYEMYRQLSLHEAEDRSMFDVKRLIYAALIATTDDRFSNRTIYDHVLDVIFESMLSTGLFPIGNPLENEYTISKVLSHIHTRVGPSKIYPVKLEEQVVNNKPILSSVECLSDMLQHKKVRLDLKLKSFPAYLERTWNWIRQRLRKDIINDKTYSIGWYPEYQGIHEEASWLAGHTLLFLKRFCKLVSKCLIDYVTEEYKATLPRDIEIGLDQIPDSYCTVEIMKQMMIKNETNNSMNKFVPNNDYCSAILHGPPGTRKTTLSKAIAKDLNWNYIEITPGHYQTEGGMMVISKAVRIFRHLLRLKKTVVLFDEVDQLVKKRDINTPSESAWIVTSLLPLLADLRKRAQIKFILATNDIKFVDPAIIRAGRIDFILPMGAIDDEPRKNWIIKEINRNMKEGIASPWSAAKLANEITEFNEIKQTVSTAKLDWNIIKILTDCSKYANIQTLKDLIKTTLELRDQNEWNEFILKLKNDAEDFSDDGIQQFDSELRDSISKEEETTNFRIPIFLDRNNEKLKNLIKTLLKDYPKLEKRSKKTRSNHNTPSAPAAIAPEKETHNTPFAPATIAPEKETHNTPFAPATIAPEKETHNTPSASTTIAPKKEIKTKTKKSATKEKIHEPA